MKTTAVLKQQTQISGKVALKLIETSNMPMREVVGYLRAYQPFNTSELIQEAIKQGWGYVMLYNLLKTGNPVENADLKLLIAKYYNFI